MPHGIRIGRCALDGHGVDAGPQWVKQLHRGEYGGVNQPDRRATQLRRAAPRPAVGDTIIERFGEPLDHVA